MTDDQVAPSVDRTHDPARVLALSDGVFAIILTLLVLEIHVPELRPGEALADALREVRPSFVAFAISFVVITIAWATHRDLFALIRATDRTIVWLNLAYLFPLCLLPFGTALLGRHNTNARALRIYGAILMAIYLGRLAIWLYATLHPHLLWRPIDRESRVAAVLLAGGPALVYAIAILIADVAPRTSLGLYAGVPVAYFLSISLLRHWAPRGSAEREFT